MMPSVLLIAAAQWITGAGAYAPPLPSFDAVQPNDVLEKRFAVRSAAVTSAVWTVAAPGMRDLSVNGTRVSPTALPPWTPYDKRVLAERFDVASLLKPGAENVLRVELGNGWYDPLPLAFWYGCVIRDSLAVGRPCVKATLAIAYADGKTETVVTDDAWRAAKGRVTRNSLYLGTAEDFRREIRFDGSAQVVQGPKGREMSAEDFPKTVVYDRWTAKDVRQISEGKWIIDLGVNFAGSFRVRLRNQPEGRRIAFRKGERLLDDGSINVMTAVAGQIKKPERGPLFGIAEERDELIADGSSEIVFEPRMAFHVFRYIQVEGVEGALLKDDFEALAWSADVKESSSFTCSNERLNRLHEVCRRTFRSNLQSVQSDCPGREKFGYGGDIACTADAFWCNYDMRAFYRKTVRDFLDEAAGDGIITETAPYVGIASRGVFPRKDKASRGSAPMGWAVGLPVLLDTLVRYAGDLEILAEAYPALVRYIGLVHGRYPDHDIPECLGDWVPPEEELKADTRLSALAHWHQFLALTAKFAGLLDRSEDAVRFGTMADEVARKFRNDFVKPDGLVGRGVQGDQLFALSHGLLNVRDVSAAEARLKNDIVARGGSLMTGIFATKYLLEYLSSHGEAELVGTVVTHEGDPGWFHMLDQGATTLWEGWHTADCTNRYSNCHPMFGSVDEWMVRHVLGIAVCDDAVGCDRVMIDPKPVAGVTSASGWFDTPKGRISVSWKLVDGKLVVEKTVPKGIEVVDPRIVRNVDRAWRRLLTEFRSPVTGLLYEHCSDSDATKFLPTPEEISRNEPIPTGWNTGMEDSILNGCPALLAAMERKDYPAFDKLYPGLMRCATVSGKPGFLARSISPADNRSFYWNSSRDQYTLFVYTMWKVARSEFATAEMRREVESVVRDIAVYAESCVTAENDYELLRFDGKRGLAMKMWTGRAKDAPRIDDRGYADFGGVLPHESERLPMFFAAAHSLTGDPHWRELELKYADDAIRMAECGMPDCSHGYALYQMQISQRLLWECESDPVRKGRYRRLLEATAKTAKVCLPRAEGILKALSGDLSAPVGDWRTWTRDLGDSVGGLVYSRPVRPKDFDRAYECVREASEGLLVRLLCPDLRLEDEEVARFEGFLRTSGFEKGNFSGIVYPVLANALLENRRRETSVRLMSFNVRHCKGMDGKLDVGRIAARIRSERPDVAGLQEIDCRTERVNGLDEPAELARLTGMTATFAKAIPYRGGEYGVMVLSRERPLSVEKVPLPGLEPRMLLICEFENYGVATMHLAVDSERARIESVELIRKAVERFRRERRKPLFLTGDWNARPDSEVLKSMAGIVKVVSDVRGNTYHGPGGDAGDRLAMDGNRHCIDYIAIDRESVSRFHARSAKIVEDRVSSDHVPIVVEGIVGGNDGCGVETIEMLPGEEWRGVANYFGMQMPFTEATRLEIDITRNSYANQYASLLLSNRGRAIWCDRQATFGFTNGTITVTAPAPVTLAEAGTCLRDAFRFASKTWFPPSGKTPDELFFLAPQYNTWIEFTYRQNEDGILAYAQSMIDNGLPPGILMIDSTWHGHYGDWDFNVRNFRDPKGMVAKLRKMGYKVVLWVCPWISLDSPEFRLLYTGIDPFRPGKFPRGGLMLDRTGYPAAVQWWDGKSAMLDFSHPRGREWFKEQLDRLVAEYGVSGFKFDGGALKTYLQDFKASQDMPKGDLANLYMDFALQYPVCEYRHAWKRGGQPLVERLHDKDHKWEDLRKLIPDMIAGGLLGHSFMCPDMVGGGEWHSFLPGAAFDPELFIRSAQVHALCGQMQFSASPWRVLTDERHRQIIRDTVALRQGFAPRFLQLARECGRTGEPMIRHLDYMFPGHGYGRIADQFVMGDFLMVAPQVEKGAATREVEIPPGRWLADDGTEYEGPRKVTVDTPLSRLPHFKCIDVKKTMRSDK